MKIALITDTHWGVRSDSPLMLDCMKKFLDEHFFSYIDAHNISCVAHLGDLVDRRKYININTARRLREDFLDKLESRNLDVHIIAGNHDTYFKNTNNVNALNELVRNQYPSFKIYDRFATPVEFDGVQIIMLPWLCDDNRDSNMRICNESNSQILFGHLELSGFEMYRGGGACHGDDPSLFNRFDIICSGHYHHRSSNGTVFYLGSPCEFTWSDFADPKGFHIFDTQTRELTFIKNPITMFDKIFYDDLNKTMDEILDFDPSTYENKYLKVIVKNKVNPYWFDVMIEKIDKVGIAEMQVVEDHLNLNLEEDTDIINEAEDTMTILRKYLNSMNPNADKNRVESIVTNLYIKAQNIE